MWTISLYSEVWKVGVEREVNHGEKSELGNWTCLISITVPSRFLLAVLGDWWYDLW